MGVFDIPLGSNVDPSADKRPSLYATSTVFGFLTLLAVGLRFLSRRLGRVPVKADDWLILASLPFAWVTNGVNIYGPTWNGEGRHINHSNPASLKRFFQATYVFLICYNIAIALAKFSLIYFYRRIFSTEGFKKPLLATAALTLAWLIACEFATIFSCSPVQGYWELDKPSKCIDERAFYTGQTASNMVLDAILLIIPIFSIARLHMSWSHKIGVCGIFALGLFVTVCSAVRLAELIKIQREQEFDFTYDITEAAYWSVIENNVGIVCACLPTLRPLLRIMLHGSPHPRSGSRPGGNSRILDSQGNMISGPFSPLESTRDPRSLARQLNWEEGTYEARVFAGSRPDSQGAGSAYRGNAGEAYEMGKTLERGNDTIKVNTEVTWFESRRPSTDTSSTEALKKDVEAGKAL